MVSDEVLSKLDSEQLSVHVVWTPVLGGDDFESTKSAVETIADPRATHYWDADGSLGQLFAEAVDLPNGRNFAWDIYLAYAPDADWKDSVPVPSEWMHQLGWDERMLDGDKLRGFVEGLLPRNETLK